MFFHRSGGGVSWLLVGLGNPGAKYASTRHNMGFLALDGLADREGFRFNKLRFRAWTAQWKVGDQQVLVMKPQTYMNLSGECIREVMDYYKADIDDLIVIFDDISLEPGRLRLRPKGSAGGHNGIKSIIAHLGSDKFKRVKFGVGDKPKGWDLADWVLGKFPAELYPQLRDGNTRACEAVECIISEGIESAMNKFNG